MTVSVLWLSLTVPWVGLQYVFQDHTHLLLARKIYLLTFLSRFCNEFNEFKYKGARMLDSVYHISLKKKITLKLLFWSEMLRVCHYVATLLWIS